MPRTAPANLLVGVPAPEPRLEPDAIGVAQDTVIGMASSAPGVSVGLTLAGLALVTAYSGGLVIIITAIPMLIIANAYRRLNMWTANCGASFEWVGRAISPWLGWMTGWLMIGPASSSTMPRLVLAMYRHARLFDGADVLDVGTGTGYGTALLTWRLGDQQVTSIDIDDYLTNAATRRLGDLGLHPMILTADAAGDLPGTFDRIVPMVSLPAIPPSWLAGLRPGGRLVFSLTGGSVLITADKTPDGGAVGRVEEHHAGFMAARHGPACPLRSPIPGPVADSDGYDITTSPYPVVDPTWGWELDAILSVTNPGLAYRTSTDPGTGIITTWMTHPDGSWARAASQPGQPATVHQSGPRRLWDTLDEIRADWLQRGMLPLRGAHSKIEPDGTCHLSRGTWHATIPAQDTP